MNNLISERLNEIEWATQTEMDIRISRFTQKCLRARSTNQFTDQPTNRHKRTHMKKNSGEK